MATERTSTANDFKGIKIIYYGLVVGQILIMFILSYLTINDATIFWLGYE